MSYCRWSCDNCRSDLYCYKDANGGYTIHVASKRLEWTPWLDPYSEGAIEAINEADDSQWQRWFELVKSYNDVLSTIPRKDIGLPHDGESFHVATPEEFLEQVNRLKAMGYHVPDSAITRIETELTEQSAAEAAG